MSGGAATPPAASLGRGRMYTRFFGIPAFCAALSAVGRRGTHVKRALDPEDFSWWTISGSLYAAFAGEEIPDSL